MSECLRDSRSLWCVQLAPWWVDKFIQEVLCLLSKRRSRTLLHTLQLQRQLKWVTNHGNGDSAHPKYYCEPQCGLCRCMLMVGLRGSPRPLIAGCQLAAGRCDAAALTA